MQEQTSQQTERGQRTTRTGTVVSAKMDKTCVVKVSRKVKHPQYGKFVVRSTKLYVHDETNDANPGDFVKVMSMRPVSKNKRWRLVEVLERAK